MVRNGYMYPNDKPGLGIDIDEKLAAKYPCEDWVERLDADPSAGRQPGAALREPRRRGGHGGRSNSSNLLCPASLSF